MSTLSTQVDIEEIQTTKSEKLLAVVFAVFLLVGGLWAYQKIDDTVRAAVGPVVADPADRAAVERHATARAELSEAERSERRALEELEIAREAYRTALDAGEPATALGRRYEEAQAAYDVAQADLAGARTEFAAAAPAAADAQKGKAAAQRRAARTESLGTFGLRLALVLATMAAAYALLGRLRTRGSRYLPLGLAAVGFGAILTLVMASDYVTDYVDPLEFGPLVLAAVGVGFTLLAFVALQRYLEKRIPIRRVRKGECPFCGFPGRGRSHCEGCGHGILAECAACAGLRRVGALHCGACGST